MSHRIHQTKTAIFSLIFLGMILTVICVDTSYSQRESSKPGPTCCLPATTTQYESSKVVYQQFPARGPAETAWVVIWSENGHKGLWIEGAWFWRKKPFTAASVVQVLGRAGLSEIFVPYHIPSADMPHNGRLFDLGSGHLLEAIPQDTGDCGTITDPLVPSPSDPVNIPDRRVLVKEIRDRGVAWTSDRHTRRGEEMLLWATYDAGNYEYIIQYGFRDDGTVTFRLGSTGYNSPVMPFEPHMHNGLWYVDINLAGAARNSVRHMRHIEPSDPNVPCAANLSTSNPNWATDCMYEGFNNGVEGFDDWNDKEFTGVNIINTVVKNAQGNNISYDLMPMRTGTARHAEAFAQHDFWVTLAKSNELQYQDVPTYVNGESIMDQDVVLWYMSSNHHHPRDEDHEFAQPIRLPGVALVMWSGFDLHPRNFFNDTPLHEPPCAMVPPNLVGWWPFEEKNGGTSILDIQASANPSINGTPKPGALGGSGPTPVPGAVNGALSLDGVNDYVEISDNSALDFGTGDFSIDAWVKTSQNTGVAVVLDKRQSMPLQGYHLFTSNGNLFLQLATGGFFNNYPANAFIADGNWHHIAVTVNRTSNPFTIKWYVDGKDKSPNNYPTPPTGSLDNAAPLRLGVRSTSLSAYWKGTLDELEIFNRALGDLEVLAIFAAGRNGKCQ